MVAVVAPLSPANSAYHYPFALRFSSVHPVVLTVPLTAPSYPLARLVLLLSSRSLHPSIFSGSNPPRFDSRGAATTPSPSSALAASRVGAIWPPLHAGYITQPRCLITQDTFLRGTGEGKGEERKTARALTFLRRSRTTPKAEGGSEIKREREDVSFPSHVLYSEFFFLSLMLFPSTR